VVEEPFSNTTAKNHIPTQSRMGYISKFTSNGRANPGPALAHEKKQRTKNKGVGGRGNLRQTRTRKPGAQPAVERRGKKHLKKKPGKPRLPRKKRDSPRKRALSRGHGDVHVRQR